MVFFCWYFKNHSNIIFLIIINVKNGCAASYFYGKYDTLRFSQGYIKTYFYSTRLH